MLNLLCNLVSKIVFSGVTGTILIIPLVIIVKVLIGQAKETFRILKEV